MKNIIFLSLFLLSGRLVDGGLVDGGLRGDIPDFINPTGTYILKGEVKNSKIIGHYGELRVRMLDSGTIALCFYLNKGYPGYNPDGDSSCVLYFSTGRNHPCSVR